MIHIFLNALAASAGAGPTYVRNIVQEISARDDVKATIALGPKLRQEFKERSNVSFLELKSSGTINRFWLEQTRLPGFIRRSGADVLISTGNFALRSSPVPQILLSGNSLYTSADFYRDVRRRHDYGAWLDTRLKSIFAKSSVSWADVTVAPSQAFAVVLQKWTGRNVICIYHGFDHAAFFRDSSPLPTEMEQKIASARSALKLLFVSHYNYYRNFETLLRAVPLIREGLAGREVRLFLTCKLNSGQTPGFYRAEAAAILAEKLGIAKEVVQLGAVPYHLLHQVYRASDIYVTPAYAETFAHPLVEAMSSGLPIVASDIAVHREICDIAALFFDRFSPEDLARQVLKVAIPRELAEELPRWGKQRSKDFSWHDHVNKIVALAQSLRTTSKKD